MVVVVVVVVVAVVVVVVVVVVQDLRVEKAVSGKARTSLRHVCDSALVCVGTLVSVGKLENRSQT